ncbi:MAG: ABC transporter ATP-binding protein [Pseudomonadota bacterium]|nr:ABC transporter ATP-binding protein [Pseudomonadota bacterium]
MFEGHLTYEFMTIAQIERFYAPHYPKWSRDHYYNLVERLQLPHCQQIKNMSCGQRSQVVLGLIMAQQAELLILDDYSMGLDAGYRRLFLDYMREYLKDGDKTVLLTSHVIQDMERFVNEILFLEHGGDLLITSPEKFMSTFQRYRLPRNGKAHDPIIDEVIKNVETHTDYWDIFSFYKKSRLIKTLEDQGFDPSELKPLTMSLEDAFIGFTGRY